MPKRNKGSLLVAVLLAVSLLFCYSAYVFAEYLEPFSADMTSRFGRQTNSARLYFSGEKVRTEMEGNIVITRLDKNVCWFVMPSGKMYMEQAIDQNMVPKTSKAVKGEVERVSLGKEILDGNEVEKFKITYMDKIARLGMYQWVLDSGFPVKMEAEDGSWVVEYKNIVFAPQPDALFEPPDGFQKISGALGGGLGMPAK